MLRIIKYIIAIIFMLPHLAFACDCARSQSPAKELLKADSVFLATVIDHTNPQYEFQRVYNFQVDKVWKGKIDGTFSHQSHHHNCAYGSFEKDQTYLIYAYKAWEEEDLGNIFEITWCSRTKEAQKAFIEMEYLDAMIDKRSEEQVHDTLIPILRTSSSAAKRLEALQFMGSLLESKSRSAAILGAVIEAAQDKDPAIRQQVAMNLNHSELLGHKEAIDALLDLLKDKDAKTRQYSSYALRSIGRGQQQVFMGLKQAFVDEYLYHSDIKDESYQKTASDLLVSIAELAPKESKTEVLDLMMEHVGDFDGYAKVGIIQRIGFMNSEAQRAYPVLIDELDKAHEGPYYLKQYIIMSLGYIGDQRAIEYIEPYLDDKNCYVVKSSIEALYKLGDDKALDLIHSKAFPLIKQRFDECSYQFITAIQTLKQDAEPLSEFLINKLESFEGSSGVKTHITQALSAIGTDKAQKALGK